MNMCKPYPLFAPIKPVAVIGAAIVDLLIAINEFPDRGGDAKAKVLKRQVGGCAFNVARALCKLGVTVINGMQVGQGIWGKTIEKSFLELGIDVILRNRLHDNGWCIAMIEPAGERTFITFTGCEAQWSANLLAQLELPFNAIIYVNGYELVGEQGKTLGEWLLDKSPHHTLLLDVGPRLKEIDREFIMALDNTATILTLNRDEVRLLCGSSDDPVILSSQYAQCHQITIICRLDKDGAWLCLPNGKIEHKAAYDVIVVDTLGAGDSHSAGILAGLSSGWLLSEAIDLGNMVAAWIVSHQGSTNMPCWEELLSRFPQER